MRCGVVLCVLIAGLGVPSPVGADTGSDGHDGQPGEKQQQASAKQTTPAASSAAFTVSGYLQGRWREHGSGDAFDLRRVRLDLGGRIARSVTCRVQADFVGPAPRLLDAAVSWRRGDALTLTAGQFKIPFSSESLTPSPRLETINRSQVVEALVARSGDVTGNQNGRDIGLLAAGRLGPAGRQGGVDYAVAVLDGSGINHGDANDSKDLAGRLVVHPLRGLSLGGSFYSGRFTPATDPARNDLRRRAGVELAYVAGRLVMRSEYIRGVDGGVRKRGWYALGGYFVIPEKLQAVIKVDVLDRNTARADDETEVATLGVNWYFKSWAFLQVDYEIKDESGRELANNALTAELTVRF